jgi:hypothetical protein
MHPLKRITIDKVDQSKPLAVWKLSLADYGRRRHLSYSMDFDSRVHSFEEPGDEWAPEARRLHLENRGRAKENLAQEFGSQDIDRKIENFVAIGPKRFSILAYHNQFFDEARRAFVIGAYYPALVSVCALGERILNHLMLDLRSFYKHTPEYKRVHKKSSFDNWNVAIDALEAWDVLLPKVIAEFRALMVLRNRSIHFNVGTYATLREDALAAIGHMREIIDQQFTAFGVRPWFIKGTRGHVFIKREWEDHPFIRNCYLPTCPFVGPYFAISFDLGLRFHDHSDYGDGEWTDEEFAAAYEARSPDQLARSS